VFVIGQTHLRRSIAIGNRDGQRISLDRIHQRRHSKGAQYPRAVTAQRHHVSVGGQGLGRPPGIADIHALDGSTSGDQRANGRTAPPFNARFDTARGQPLGKRRGIARLVLDGMITANNTRQGMRQRRLDGKQLLRRFEYAFAPKLGHHAHRSLRKCKLRRFGIKM
jgi:hypothetical protein